MDSNGACIESCGGIIGCNKYWKSCNEGCSCATVSPGTSRTELCYPLDCNDHSFDVSSGCINCGAFMLDPTDNQCKEFSKVVCSGLIPRECDQGFKCRTDPICRGNRGQNLEECQPQVIMCLVPPCPPPIEPKVCLKSNGQCTSQRDCDTSTVLEQCVGFRADGIGNCVEYQYDLSLP